MRSVFLGSLERDVAGLVGSSRRAHRFFLFVFRWEVTAPGRSRAFSDLMLRQAAALRVSLSQVVPLRHSHVTPDGGRYHFIEVGGLTSEIVPMSLG